MVENSKPELTIVPGDDASGLCPTLLVDGLQLHDRVQPYQEVLALEGTEPQVVALFGVGLGYTAAGALLLAPNAKVIAWEPLPDVADIARRMLREEWNLEHRVQFETDLADFQARLIDAVNGAESLAIVELRALTERFPELTQAFRAVVGEVIDAETLGSVATVSSEGWAHIGQTATKMAELPLLSSLTGAVSGRRAVAVTAPSLTAEQIAEIRGAVAAGAMVIAGVSSVQALNQSGISIDLAVVHETDPPSAELGSALASTVLAITPDSHPAWRAVPAPQKLLFGHSSVAWLLNEGDAAAITSFRFGAEIPVALAALSLGARPIAMVTAGSDPSARWNLLHPTHRAQRVIDRCSKLAGAEFVPLAKLTALPASVPNARFQELARSQARLLGAHDLRRNLTRARRAIGRLAREHRQFARYGNQPLLALYLKLRAEGHPFTRAFMNQSPGTRVEGLSEVEHRRDAGFGLLDWIEEQLPPAPISPSLVTTGEVEPAADDTIRIFIAAGREDEVATRVLLWSLDSFSRRRLEIHHLRQEIPARFGARAAALPPSLQALFVPALCNHAGRAIVIEPSVVVTEEIGLLWDQPLAGNIALAPDNQPGALLLIDCAAAAWRPMEIVTKFESGELLGPQLLTPGSSPRIGKLPTEWGERDRLPLEAAAVRFSCAPWLPWKKDLHPITWVWEFQLMGALADGYLSARQLNEAIERGEARTTLAHLANAKPGSAVGGADRSSAPSTELVNR